MSEKHEIAINEQQQALFRPETNMIFDSQRFAALDGLATVMASGVSTIPHHLAGNKGDCFAVAMQAMQWGMNPFAVAQKTHIVSGTLGYEAQLVNSVIYSMAPTKDRIKYEWYGPWENVIGKFEWREGKNGNRYQVPGWKTTDEAGCGVKVWATLKGEDEPRELSLLLSQATVRNSTLWASDPKQQLAYLAVKRWVRLYCPEVLLGVYTPDELAEEPANITPPEELAKINAASGNSASEKLLDRLKGKTAAVFREQNPADAPETAENSKVSGQESPKTEKTGKDTSNTEPAPKSPETPNSPSVDDVLSALGNISADMLLAFIATLDPKSGWVYSSLEDMPTAKRSALIANRKAWNAKINAWLDGGGEK